MEEAPKLVEALDSLSQKVRVPKAYFKAILGLPLPVCSADTIEAAESAHVNAEDGSDEEAAAYIKLSHLLMEAALAATTVKQVSALWQRAPSPGIAEEAINQKWFELASSIEELEQLWDRLPLHSRQAKKVLLKMWDIHVAALRTQ